MRHEIKSKSCPGCISLHSWAADHQFDRSNPFCSHYINICGLMTTEKRPPEMEFQKQDLLLPHDEKSHWSLCVRCESMFPVSRFFLSLNDRLNGSLQCLAHSVHIYWNNVCAVFTHTLICNQFALPCQSLKQSNESTRLLQVLIEKFQHQHIKNFKGTCSQKTLLQV